jgi:hypothetical protein
MWNSLVIWFFQLGFKLTLILILFIIITPFSTYFHYTLPHTDQARNFYQYAWGFLYRGGVFFLFLYIADAARFIFQSKE